MNEAKEQMVKVSIGSVTLEGMLTMPSEAKGIVLFAHGAGSSRFSPRNNFVAKVLHDAGFATLLFDLLTEEEDKTYENRFNIPLLAERLIAATRWIQKHTETKNLKIMRTTNRSQAHLSFPNLKIGYFGSSTGSAAALIAASELGDAIGAAVSRGGRPDLVDATTLAKVRAPTLLIIGGNDEAVIEMNRTAYAYLKCKKEMKIIPGATHLFEEPGALEEVARLAAKWFREQL